MPGRIDFGKIELNIVHQAVTAIKEHDEAKKKKAGIPCSGDVFKVGYDAFTDLVRKKCLQFPKDSIGIMEGGS